MRQVHGSMMDAVVPDRPGREALLGPLHAASAPVARGAAFQGLMAQMAGRQAAHALHAGPALPLLALDPRAWQEAMDLGQAAMQQWLALQGAWLQGLHELGGEVAQLRQANTLSKVADQEMNLLQQALALCASQFIATVRLGENIENNWAFWLSRRQAGEREPARG